MFLLLCAVVLVLVLDWGVPIFVNDDALVFELALAGALALHETRKSFQFAIAGRL